MKGTLLFLLFSLVVIVSCDKINFDNEQLDSVIRTKVELGAKIHHIAENLVESKVHYVVKKGALDALEYHKHSVSQLHLRKDLAQHADDLHMKLREFEIKLLEKDNNYYSVFNKRNLEDSNNSTQLKSNLLDLLSNFPQAKTWLAECNTATCINFIIELAGDNRDYYVAEFLELMISLNFTSPGITPELQDNFVLVMLQLFYKQTEHNPPLYVSHGTDHSVRAMSWVDQLQTLVDEGLETTYGSYSKNHSKFMLYLNTILHDTGYIWIESPKFLHAAASGILTDQFITTNTTNVGALMLNESAELNENLINDFIFALSTHNYDDQLCLFKTGDEYSKCLYIYEPAKKNITGITKNYTRDYVPVNAISKPFGFVVRIADNFDATYYRLTITQRHEFLVQFWLRLYTDFDLRTAVANKVDQNPALSAARENALNSMPELKAYYEDTNSQVKDIVDKSNSESFLHFYSNWIVQNMTYDNYVLTVNFRNPVEEELRYYHHPGPALYQVNRLASSMLSCYTASNTSFIDAIQVELNPPLPNATKSRFSLRSFTKKPIYDENGKNGFICTPHCDDLSFLTISPEPCLTYVNGQIAVSKECPYVDFGKVSPYSDLSYPNTTQTTTTSSTTSSTTGESVETSGSSIVTLCAFVMLFNLLVVVLF